MKKALVVGGNSGIGLALTIALIERGYGHVYVLGKDEPNINDIPKDKVVEFQQKTSFSKINLIQEDYTQFSKIQDIDTLIITVGFGRVAPFEDLKEEEITNLVKCNELAIIRIIKSYYSKIKNDENFYCAVMGSIAGHLSSPLFSVYGATKAGVCRFIESINAELAHDGFTNRVLDVSPGSLKGTNFNGQGNDLSLVFETANAIIDKMLAREILYIPNYEEIYKDVLKRYHENALQYGIESYDYKVKGNRISSKPQVIVGYLSGTFDLFHIGHLNLLKRAKMQCDYLIVGVHKSGAWKGKETYIPFEERCAIVESVKYVDKVIESFTEDADAYDALKFNKLFVGSDYKGSERFQRYEKYFSDKNVEIVYFPYTKGTSSTQLRDAIKADKK